MVSVKVNDVDVIIDGRLEREISNKIIPMLQKKDKDCVFIVDGPERSGKSVYSMQLGGFVASKLGTRFDLSNVCMTPEEFKRRIEYSNKNDVIVYDEAHRGMASRRALSEINGILTDLMMEMGQRNLFVIIVLPTFFMLDRYPALFRARGLFHVYENKNRRGFWVYFNQKNKLKLFMKGKKEFNYNCMKFPGFRGRFYDKYVIDEDGYREKKGNSFKTRERNTKAEKYVEQRNKLIWYMHKKFNLNTFDLKFNLKEAGVPMQSTNINDILREFRVKSGFGNETRGINDSIIPIKVKNEAGGGEEEENEEEMDDPAYNNSSLGVEDSPEALIGVEETEE